MSDDSESGKRARQDESMEGGKKAKNSAAILKELLEEQQKLAPFLTMLPHCAQLLKDLGNGMCKTSIKVPAPTEKYQGFNFVGRLLGPRGNTLKELQRDSGCKMLIRGKGSLKLKSGETEEELAKQPVHAHLSEQLHVIVDYEGPIDRKDAALRRAKEMLKVLLHPPASEEEDIVKRNQLRELALINGTFKEHTVDRGGGGGHSGGHSGGGGGRGGRGRDGGGGGGDWMGGGGGYQDPALLAYNRGLMQAAAAMSGAGGWGNPPYGYEPYPPPPQGYHQYPQGGGY